MITKEQLADEYEVGVSKAKRSGYASSRSIMVINALRSMTKVEEQWNAAIEAAARTVETRGCGECDFHKIYARDIRALKREETT